MCHFITLIVPTEDGEAVQAVMKRHGRAAAPIDNPSIRKLLREDEQQYLTTHGHCDCDTVLARRHTAEEIEERLAREAARLKRKGWSAAKIARAMDDQHKADARPKGRPKGYGADSLELWNAALCDLGETLKLSHAGLFVRSYSGDIAVEGFAASRRDVRRDITLLEGLATLEEDEVTIFPLR